MRFLYILNGLEDELPKSFRGYYDISNDFVVPVQCNKKKEKLKNWLAKRGIDLSTLKIKRDSWSMI